MKEVLTGFELEKWVEQFALKAKIAAPTLPSASTVLKTAEQYLPKRLDNALMFIDGSIPDGKELAESLLRRPDLILPAAEDQQLSRYVLDKAIATDILLQFKNQSGRYVRLAVDVTSDTSAKQLKLDRIKGFPSPKDKMGTNRNFDFSKARDALGIDKHLILVLNSKSVRLPSHEKLLREIQAFANSPEQTKLTDLQNVKPSELYFAESRFLKDPQRLFEKYQGQFTPSSSPGKQLKELANFAILDGHPKERVRDIVLQHPFFDGYRNKSKLPTAKEMATNVYLNQIKSLEVGKEAEIQSKQETQREQRPEPGSREDVLDAARYIAKEIGERDGSGLVEAEVGDCLIEIEGSEVIVWNDNGEKVIDIAPDSNRDIYQPSSELVAHLTSFADELEQQEFELEQESEQQVDEGFGIDDD